MTTHDAFLADIIANPADDTPRLIFADWLEEHDEADRAEFIRMQCELEPLRGEVCICDPEKRNPECKWGRFQELSKRERELLDAHGDEWFGWGEITGPTDHVQRRGFIWAITCTAADWLAHADALTAAQPIERVELTTLLPFIAAKSMGRRWNESMEEFLERLWPHITFTLPRAYTNVGISYSSNLTPKK